MEFGVVVLNYNDYRSTIACVWSLLRCRPQPGHLVIVDNRSLNQSLAVLTKEFAGVDNLAVIDSGHNGGYSFGHNVGIRYLRQMGAKHVLLATGDTEVISPDLFSVLGTAIGPRIGIVAPQIIGPAGFQNPSVACLNIKYILDLIWIQNGMPGLRVRRGISQSIRSLHSRIKRREIGARVGSEQQQAEVRKVYKLHGAFLCLTETFLELVSELDERIFMFGEEDLLAWKCIDGGLEQVLRNGARVRHGNDSSIKLTWGSQAQRFVDDETRKSAKVLKKEINIFRLLRFWWNG